MSDKVKAKKSLFANTFTDPMHFNNRELSWLEFNDRVLNEARENYNPLLERLRFLTIFTSNLDEFYMKRVGGLKRQVASGISYKSVDGLTQQEQLYKIREKIIILRKKAYKIFNELMEQLKNAEIDLLNFSMLNKKQKLFVKNYFHERIFPVLTPLSVDPGHPFPFISNLSYSIGVSIRHPIDKTEFFSRIKLPEILPQWILLPRNFGERYQFISLESVVKQHLDQLFPGMEILDTVNFKITRNADLEHDDEDAEDLLEMIEIGIKERRLAEVIRLEIPIGKNAKLQKFLAAELKLTPDDIYELNEPIDLSRFREVLALDIPEFKFPIWKPMIPPALIDETHKIFAHMRRTDILLHHPYETFSGSVERFINSAARDPKVLAIKMTLYRTGDHSPFVKSLIRAAERGKQVVCLVELKARFEERRNIQWAQKLEEAGVHVVYGVLGLKTHAKIALVIRQELDGSFRPYAHISTGNYNAETALQYTDLGLLTCNKNICRELIEVFNYLTGRSLKTDYQHLLVAPINMKSSFIQLIKQEIKNSRLGKPAQIIAKMNSLEDVKIAQQLYIASQAGVKIHLIVRGVCVIKPGIPEVSENIIVTSIIGRFLEHSRFFYFANGSHKMIDGKFFIGSADWMHRNLHGRVEVITPIDDLKAKQKIIDFYDVIKQDRAQSWRQSSHGSYVKLKAKVKSQGDSATHMRMMEYARKQN